MGARTNRVCGGVAAMVPRRLAVALILCALPAAVLATPADAGDRFRVYDFQPISGPNPFDDPDCGLRVPPPLDGTAFRPKDTAFEPHAAVDPNDPDRIAAAWIQDFSVGFVAAYTDDGGRTWRRSVPPGLSDCNGAEEDAGSYDPRLSFGPDGRLYLSGMTGGVDVGATAPSNGVYVLHSDDGGKSWSQPVTVEPQEGTYNDYPTVVADPDEPGRVRIAWSLHNGPFGGNTPAILYSESADGGLTWTPSQTISTPPVAHFVDGVLVELENDTLLWASSRLDSLNSVSPGPQEPRVMEALHSTDGGASWLGPVKIGEQSRERSVRDEEQGLPIERGGIPTVTALPRAGVVAAWSEVGEDGRGRIVLARSRDGVSWAPAETVIDGPAPVFAPTIAASGDGRIAITYFDLRRDEPGDAELTTDFRFASSADGGRTWTRGLRLASFDYRTAWKDPRSPGSPVLNVGDYGGLVGLPHGFVAVPTLARPAAKIGKSQAFSAVLLRLLRPVAQVRVSERKGEGEVVLRLRAVVADGREREPAAGLRVRSGKSQAVTNDQGRAKLVRGSNRDHRYTVRLAGRGYRRAQLTARFGG